MKKIKLTLLMILLCNIAFTQERISNDTVYIYDIPIAKITIVNNIKTEIYENEVINYPINNILIKSFNIVDDYVIKFILHDIYKYNNSFIFSYLSLNDSIINCYNFNILLPYLTDIKLQKIGKLRETMTTVAFIGLPITLITTILYPPLGLVIAAAIGITELSLNDNINSLYKRKANQNLSHKIK